MWAQVIELGVIAGIYLYNYLTRESPKPPKAKGLDLPQTDENTQIPYVVGRMRVRVPILAWTSALSSRVVDNANNGSQFITYGLNMFYVVGIPMGTPGLWANRTGQFTPRLHNSWMSDNKLPPPAGGFLPYAGHHVTSSPPLITDTSIVDAQWVQRTGLFGGPGNGGGLLGIYSWFPGCTDQVLDPNLHFVATAMQDDGLDVTKLPGYRRMMCVGFSQHNPLHTPQYPNYPGVDAFDHDPSDAGGAGVVDTTIVDQVVPNAFSLGENPALGPLSFEVSAYGNGVFSMMQPGVDFGGDADPVEVIYDILTNKWARVGLDPSKIDTSSFSAASATLKAENHGYSAAITNLADAVSVLTEILKQIDATLYEEPTTGLLTLKLIRADYDPNNPAQCPVFDTTHIISVDKYDLGTFRDTPNEVRVSYTDRGAEYATGVAVAQSLSNAVGNSNRRRPISVSYPGCTNGVLGGQLAARDLNIVSRPLGKISITIDRTAWRLRPGSVFKVTYPQYNLNGIVFRAGKVDIGALEDNKVKIEAVQDVFATSYVGFANAWTTLPANSPFPLRYRLVTETPRWIAQDAANAGLLTDVDVPHVIAIAPPSTNAVQYELRSRQELFPGLFGISPIGAQFAQDIKQQNFPTTFVCRGTYGVTGKYPRTLEPYDTTTGMLVDTVVGELAATFATLAANHDDIANHGYTLFVVWDPVTGEHEYMAFESITAVGGNQYRFNNVWRGLFDTPARDWPIGSLGALVTSTLVSRRGWSKKKPIRAWMIPRATFVTGSGGDPTDLVQPVGRAACPLPPADQTIAGQAIYGGVLGQPSNARFKAATWLEEAVDFYGRIRNRLSGSIRRGDEADDTLADFSATTYFPVASPSGVFGQGGTRTKVMSLFASPSGVGDTILDPVPDTLGLYCDGTNLANGITLSGALGGGGWQVDGYGQLGLGLVSSRFVNVGDPLNGIGGITYNDTFVDWRTPLASVYLPPWRNLLANVRFSYNNGSNAAWHDNNGISSIGSSNFSLSHSSTGKFLQTTVSSTLNTGQLVSILAYNPIGLTAVGVGYFRNNNSDTNDTANLKIKCLRGTGLAASGASAPPIANWQRYTTSLVIPSDAVFTAGSTRNCFVELQAEMVEVALGGGTNGVADTCGDEFEFRLGQFATTNGLANYSFDSGTTASWTVDSGGFAVVAGSSGPSPDYAQGGAFATSVMHQDYALPAGYEYGSDAFITVFMASTLANDTAKVTIAALDVSNTVLATSDTGAQSFATLSVWSKFAAYVACPDGTTKIRVTLTATRTLGAGNSGAIFDEVALWVSKALAPRTRYSFDFSAPTVQPMPDSWQGYFKAWPTNPQPNHVFGGLDFNGEEMHWSDTATHAVGKLVGQFGGGSTSVSAYSSTRGTGAGAPCPKAQGIGQQKLGAYASTASFSAAVFYRTDEPTWAAEAGIVGRMNLSRGWDLHINSSRQLEARLRGSGATVTVATGRTLTDGALAFGAVVYDAVNHLLWVYDEVGGVSASTAALGEIAVSATSATFKLCRGADDHDTLPGMLARCYLFDTVALSAGQVTTHWSYAKDPSGLITTYTRTAAALVPGPVDGYGATLYVLPAAQVAIPYYAPMAADGGTGYALPLGKSTTNLATSFDFTDASKWVLDASATKTTGIVDPTGRPRGCTFVGDASNGVKLKGLTAGAGTISMVLWARASAGTPSLSVEIRNSSGTLISTATIALTTSWQLLYTGGTWDASTGTFDVRFVSTAGALTFDLAGALWVGAGTDFPAIFPATALGTHGDYNATAAITLPSQLNNEGEISAQGTCIIASPTPAVGTLVSIQNGVDNKNRRDLAILSTQKFRCATWDATPTEVDADYGTSTLASQVWRARARWNRAQLLDTAIGATSTPFSSMAYRDPTTTGYAAVTGRTTAPTLTATQATTIKLGVGVAAPSDMLLRRVVVQTCQEKL